MDIRQLPKELQRKAEGELNEKPTRVKEDIEFVKAWIAKQPHLNVRPGESFWIFFRSI